MPERWERELRKLGGLDVAEAPVRDRVVRGPTGDRMPPRRERVVAGVVAALVAVGAGTFAWRALGPTTNGVAVAPGPWPIATVSFSMSENGGRLATLASEGATQTGLVGESTSPDETYPYAWVNPTLGAQPIEIPMGSELRLEGDVAIEELLYGDAEQLDAGAGPDSGPIYSNQPDFSSPYFLPWDEQSERTYLKFFGTWPDGRVLDVYFEVVFVAPDVDLSDPFAEILVTPEPMEAAFVYGGQRSVMGTLGGSFGGSSVTAEPAGYEEEAIVAQVPVGTPFEIGGDRLVEATVRAGDLPYGEGGDLLDGRVPAEPGRYVLTMDVTWDGGSATFLHQIEVVPALAPSPSVTAAPTPAPPGAVVVDIRRASESTGDPGAIARFGTQEQWMCLDGWTVVNPDGTEESILFDCGQDEVFAAPTGTPITVTGDFETLNVASAWREPGTIGPSTDQVAAAEPGTVVTYSYEVTWADGSEASFWLLLTVQGDPEERSATQPEFVIRYYGIGERSTEEPTVTATFGGETRRGCTQAFEWTLPDGTTRDEDDAAGPAGRRAECSSEPLFRIPPGTPIVMVADTALDIVRSRTTAPFYGGPDGAGASVRWPEGHAEFLVRFEVDSTGFTPPEIELACAPDDRLPFAHPGGGVILPGGSSFITGNIVGFLLGSDVVEQMTREANGETEWSGIWQVVRDGEIVATVDWDLLSGTACRGSGIGGV